jgi:hypothetical protein
MSNDQARIASHAGSVNARNRVRFSAMLFACLLCFALGCSEISELAGLQDDTSNDCVYTLRRSSDCRRLAASDSDRITPVALALLLQGNMRPAPKISQPEFVGTGSSRSVGELLHFLSIQRT